MPHARSRFNGPTTSDESAMAVRRFETGHYAAILTVLRLDGPGTAHDIAARVTRDGWPGGMLAHQIGKRLGELERSGLVEPTGATPPSPTGHPCRVWRLKAVPA